MPQSYNLILAALPQNIFAAMEPHLEHTTLGFGDIIADTGAIRLLDIWQLEEGACECYETVKGHYDCMLAK